MTHDKSKSGSLLIKGGRVIDPAAKLDAPMDLLLRDGRVAGLCPIEREERISSPFTRRGDTA